MSVAARGPAALRHLAQRGRDAGDRPAYAQAATRTLVSILECQACELYRVDRHERNLVLEATSDGRNAGLIGAVGLGTGDQEFGRAALRSDQPLLVPDVHDEGRFVLPPDLVNGAVSLLSVRLADESGPCGLLVLRRDTVQPFGAEEIGFAEVAADVVALGLARFDALSTTERMLEHDGVTGLPNRTGLLRRLAGSLASVVPGTRVGVLVLGVDDYARLAHSQGQATADSYIADVGERLLDALRPGDFVARYSEDQFAVICEGLITETDAVASATALLRALTPKFEINQTSWATTVSIGIAEAEDREMDPDRLVSDAASATREARRRGRGRIEQFDRRLRDEVVNRVRTESILSDVVERDELVLHYQTVHDLETTAVIGVEALVRWDHPAHGLLPPSEFLPVAEEAELIDAIDAWVLRTAAEQAERWREQHPDLELAVNLSGHCVSEEWMEECLGPALRETGLPPSALRIDLPGTRGGADLDRLAAAAAMLRERGVRLGLDGVGTDAVVLADVPTVRPDLLTLARPLIASLDTVEGGGAVASAIALLGDLLEISVGAQGIETVEQLTYLRQLGCRVGQGYLFAFPCTAEEVSLTGATVEMPEPPPGFLADSGAATGGSISDDLAMDELPAEGDSADTAEDAA